MRKLAMATSAVALTLAVSLLALAATMWPPTAAPAPSTSAAARTAPNVIGPIHAQGRTSVQILKTDPESAAERVEPRRVLIPSLNIAIPVTALGLTPSRGMALPPTADEAAWYRHGGLPGDPDEAALIAAHVGDERGFGEFARLGAAQPGATVAVELSDGTVLDYVIVDVAQLSKQRIDVPQMLEDARGMLVLMTCGGRWNSETQHYEDNVLAWAMPSEISWSAR